jgi:phospholipase/lecithinase/hemolysin
VFDPTLDQTSRSSIVRLTPVLAAALAWGVLAQPAAAGHIQVSQYVVFGDSLSDTGNFRSRSGNIPGPGFFGGNFTTGRFTNGPGADPANTQYTGVWHEQLAGMLGLPAATPSSGGGTNFAFGGATTADGQRDITRGFLTLATVDNLGRQVSDFVGRYPNGKVPADVLYMLWAGGNDLINAATSRGATPMDVAAAEQQAINNLVSAISVLANSGGTTFLWIDLPPLDKTPEAAALSPELRAALATASSDFQRDEHNRIVDLQMILPGIQIVELDVYDLFNAAAANPGAYSLTDVTHPARGQNVNPDDYLFWDNLHPTTHGHNLIAQAAYAQLLASGVNPVPVPPTVVLLATAVPLLWRFRRRRAA